MPVLERAVEALTLLVREEYGDSMPLAEIAFIWGGASPAQIDALRQIEGVSRGEASGELAHHPLQSRQVQAPEIGE